MWSSFFNSQPNRKLETRLDIKLENQMLKRKILNFEKAYSIRLAKNTGRIPGVNYLIECMTRSKNNLNDEL